MATFFILIPDTISGTFFDAEGAEVVAKGLDKTWLAGQGVIAGMIAGLFLLLLLGWILGVELED